MIFKFMQRRKVMRRNLVFLFLVCIFSVYSNNCNRLLNPPQELLEEAFVTYGTENYFPLIEVLLDSVKAFSMHPIVVFGVNADVPFSHEQYPFMIKKRIDIADASWGSVCCVKPRVLLESGIKNAVYLDADIILNKDCDTLFEYFKTQMHFPLSHAHPYQRPSNQKLIMAAMSVSEATTPYLHNPIIIFNEQCHSFIREWLDYNKFGCLSRAPDESVYNVLLWKHHARDYIDLCVPFFTLAEDYLNGKRTDYGGDYAGKINFSIFHGCKDADMAGQILSRLIEKSRM